MNTDSSHEESVRPLAFKVIAWVCLCVLLIVSLGLYAFAEAVRSDVFFDRYYSHYPMSELTAVMTSHPVLMTLFQLLWLPFIIAFQSQINPKGILLLPLIGTMLIVVATVFILILISGPPIQM